MDKYTNLVIIKKLLIKQYNEIENNNRKTFSPGIFIGLQGKINCSILLKHVITNVLKWDFSTAVHKLNYKILYKNHLRSAKQCFKSLYELLNFTYPHRKLKPYYFSRHKGVWFKNNGEKNTDLIKEAIREFIDILTNPHGKYKYKFKKIPKWISYKLFQKKILPYNNNLGYMLSICFNNSPIDAIIFAYPELNLKPYYFKHVPKNFWKGEQGLINARIIMNEVYDKLTDKKGKYKFSHDEFFELFKYKTFHKPLLPYGKKLSGMLQVLFNNSPVKPLELIDSNTCNDICDVCEQEKKSTCVHNKTSVISIS